MATPQTYQHYALPLSTVEAHESITGMNKLFAAAIVNNQFCQLLLNEPKLALRQGYLGDAFDVVGERNEFFYLFIDLFIYFLLSFS